MVLWWLYCGTLIYSMPVVINDYHIYVPWYLHGTPKNTVKLPWCMCKNHGNGPRTMILCNKNMVLC